MREVMTAARVEEVFRRELQGLVDKWGARIIADDHFIGRPTFGFDVRITVDIPAVYDGANFMVSEGCYIILGDSVFPNRKVPTEGEIE